MTTITIRSSRPTDASELRRLASLDSQRPLTGEAIVAEICGEVVAAYSPASSRSIADPFRRTADVVEMLRLRAATDRPASQRDTQRHGVFALPRLA